MFNGAKVYKCLKRKLEKRDILFLFRYMCRRKLSAVDCAILVEIQFFCERNWNSVLPSRVHSLVAAQRQHLGRVGSLVATMRDSLGICLIFSIKRRSYFWYAGDCVAKLREHIRCAGCALQNYGKVSGAPEVYCKTAGRFQACRKSCCKTAGAFSARRMCSRSFATTKNVSQVIPADTVVDNVVFLYC